VSSAGQGEGNLSLKVLVAEDNMIEQMSLRKLLEGAGCRVITVGNGKEAVDEFETGEFDLVLMDILMPEMDGFMATRLIREKERLSGSNTPVLALTSYSLAAIREKCESVGMNGYLAKPVGIKKLLETLSNYSSLITNSVCVHEEKPCSEDNTLSVLDPRETLKNIDYDLDLYRSIVEMYLDQFVNMPEELICHLAGDDLSDIEKSAHALKGVVANLGAFRFMELAREIQDMARSGTKPEITRFGRLVKDQSTLLKGELENIDWGALERFCAGAHRTK
jgi:CheY-like chemotaxis protein